MTLQRDQPLEWPASDRVIGPVEERPNGISTSSRKLSGMSPKHVWDVETRRIGRSEQDRRPDIVGHENHGDRNGR